MLKLHKFDYANQRFSVSLIMLKLHKFDYANQRFSVSLIMLKLHKFDYANQRFSVSLYADTSICIRLFGMQVLHKYIRIKENQSLEKENTQLPLEKENTDCLSIIF